ncbi:MAG: TolC family outer membrane protein [Amaricoccus sp.]|uniref:TolC family outer membrane protein n=1 Tax=Amaricoccus sp. TaxID=1872485 RepID=UPI0039E41DC3
MRKLLRTSAIAALLAVSAGAAGAESLADALIKAYQTSPLLDANRAALRGLDEGVPQASSARKPQVGLSVGATTQSSAEDLDGDHLSNAQAALSASLLIYDHGQTAAAVSSATNRIAAGRADLTNVEQQVLYNAIVAYADVRRTQEFVRLGKSDVDRLTETLDATRNRYDVGEVTRTDVSQSESRLAASRSTLANSQGALEVARQSYRQAVGTLPGKLDPLPPLPAVPKTSDEAERIAMQRHPQIVSAQFSERAAVYDFDRALALKGPTVSLTGSVGAERGNTNGYWDGVGYGQVGIEGQLPLYTGGQNDSVIRQAQDLLDQRRFEVQDTARTVTEQVAEAWANLETSKVTIGARREQADAARIAAEGVAEEARLGARSTLDVLDADQERLQADADIVQAVRDEYVAAYGLLRAMGLLTVEHLKLGIETYDPNANFVAVRDGRPGGYDTKAVDRIRSRWETK